jgi:hypothetical protein
MLYTCLFPDALTIEPSTAEPIARQARHLFARYRQTECFDDDAAVPLEMPWEKWLRQQFAVDNAASMEASTAFVDQAPTPCWRLTPVHLHLGRDHMVLTDPTQLKLDLVAAHALHASIAPLLHESGLQLLIKQPDHWYLSTLDATDSRFAGLIAHGWRAANGRNIDAYNPIGDAARQWRRLLNEVQMTWHQHPVNEERAQRGLPAVNSLWFDGLAGAAKATPFAICYTDLPSLKGLIRSIPGDGVNRDQRSVRLVDLSDNSDRNSFKDISNVNDSAATQSAGGGILIALDPLKRVMSDGEYRSMMIWQMIEPLVSKLKGNVRMVLTGERRLLVLERNRIDQWAFWRRADTEGWFEWTNRDH